MAIRCKSAFFYFVFLITYAKCGEPKNAPSTVISDVEKSNLPKAGTAAPIVISHGDESNLPKAGTTTPAFVFNAKQDAMNLHNAILKNAGVNASVVIDILAERTSDERREIAKFYASYSRNGNKQLSDDIETKLTGDLRELLMALFPPSDGYFADELYWAMFSSVNVDHSTVIDVFSVLESAQRQYVRVKYEQRYRNSLVSDFEERLEGDFRALLVSLVSHEASMTTDDDWTLIEEAVMLLTAGDNFPAVLTEIVSKRTFEGLRTIFPKYGQLSGKPIEDKIANQFSDNSRRLLLAFVKRAKFESNPEYFARRLYESIGKESLKRRPIIRTVAAATESDRRSIGREFKTLHLTTLEDALRNKHLGDFGRALVLMTLANERKPKHIMDTSR